MKKCNLILGVMILLLSLMFYMSWNNRKNEWKTAYINCLENDIDNSQYEYTLIHINDDSIPELVMMGNCEAVGTMIGVYHNGKVELEQLNRTDFTYLPKENLLLDYGGNMGYYIDNIYSIQNNQLTLIAGGVRELKDEELSFDDENNYNYSWGSESVSPSVYYQKLNEVYDVSREQAGYQCEPMLNVNDMVEFIQNY